MEEPNIFTTSSPSDRARYRRLPSHGFSRQEVLVYQAQIWKTVKIMAVILGHECATGAPIELSKMFCSLALDVISKFVYGESFGSLLIPKFQDDVLEAFDRFQSANFFVIYHTIHQGISADSA
jgi:cytochrome P450